MGLQTETKTHTTSIPLNELRTAENFLLICLRLWSQQNTLNPPVPALDWRNGFNAVGLQETDQQRFDKMLSTMLATRQVTFNIKYYACPVANEDELWFLECVALAQQGDWPGLAGALCDRLSDQCQPRLIPMFHDFGQAMAEVGLRLLFSNTNKTSDYRLRVRQQPVFSVIPGKLH